ncbi:MAG TPA: acyl-CoA dehydrogenase family protein [Acidimicrobiales bacterium]|nr:acyl-CoA dehydrogenase family protein [Acidimicrobiales bacterium]
MGDEVEAIRQDARAFLAENLTPATLDEMERTGTHHDPGFTRALGARGWVAPGWPKEEGGAGLNVLEQSVLSEELRRAQAPMDGIGTAMLVAATLRIWGTPEQKAAVLGPFTRGELLISLGYSEADSGSDVAAARTRSRRDGDEWVIDGEKMFTSLAQVADYVFLLTRSDAEAPKKHQGLTMFLVPIDAPGLTVSEVKTLGGERTNITSYDGVRVPDGARVGEVGGGWAVLTTALELEHSGGFATEIERVLAVAVAEASQPDDSGGRLIDDSSVRLRLARIAIDIEVARLLQRRSAWMYSVGQHPVAEGPMAKVYSSEVFTAACSTLLDIFGPDGLRREHGLAAGGLGVIEHAYRHSQVTRIYAGTSEIQRSIIAERGLGLPRTRRAG